MLHFEVLYTSCNFLTFSVLFKGSRDLARMIKKGLHTKIMLRAAILAISNSNDIFFVKDRKLHDIC